MDFNMKKLASDAGVFFTRAVQTPPKIGQRRSYDRQKSCSNRIPVPSRVTNGELLAQYMMEAASDFGATTPYGKTLIKVGETERRLGGAERDFIHAASINFLTPLRNFLEGDWRTISAVPDFQETRPRNYILSASAAALWSDEVEKAEHELRLAQTEFDRQAEVNHLRCLHEFAEAQTTYFAQCYQYMLDLQKQLNRLPGTFVGNTESTSPPPNAASPTAMVAAAGPAVPTLPVVPTIAGAPNSAPGVEALNPSEVKPPSSGTRKARVLYDYDAADSSELSLLSDEMITVYSLPGMDPDWLIGERGNKKGKVPVTYLELLS
ncbi:hypothetical protein E2320_006617 [Naja naja]|nr:hypothetical protein E2320_006617 [Naja naja]